MASGESSLSSAERTRASKASATRPASSGIGVRLDDDRDSAAVRAPGGSRDVRGPLGGQECGDGGDLLRLGKAAEWSAGADLREHFLAVALLVRQPALPQPRIGRGRTRSDRVAPNPLAGIE